MKKENKKPKLLNSEMFGGEIILRDGKKKIKWNSASWVGYQISKFSVGDKITAYVSNQKPKRSLAQNSYYRLYLKMIEDETGETSDNLHAFFKGKFLTEKIVKIFGQNVRQIKSTTKLNKAEFCDYLLEIEKMTDVPLPETGDYSPTTYKPSEIDYPESTGETKF